MSASAFPRPPADDGNQTGARSHSQASLAARPASRAPSTKGTGSARGQPRSWQATAPEGQSIPHGFAAHPRHAVRQADLANADADNGPGRARIGLERIAVTLRSGRVGRAVDGAGSWGNCGEATEARGGERG